jgi:hypothetical protein
MEDLRIQHVYHVQPTCACHSADALTNSHPCPKHPPPPHTHRLNATPPTTAVIRSHTTALCIQQTHPQPSLHSSSPHPAQDMELTACTTRRPSAPALATATACTQPCPRSCLAPLAALQSLPPAAHQGREVGHWGPLGCSAILHPAPHHPGAQGAAGGGCGCCHGPVAVVAAWSVLPQQGVLQWQHQRWLLQLVAVRHQLHARPPPLAARRSSVSLRITTSVVGGQRQAQLEVTLPCVLSCSAVSSAMQHAEFVCRCADTYTPSARHLQQVATCVGCVL